MIYFTADPHFDHTNIIRHCDRPFGSTEEMNETMISNWNAKVQSDDTIYVLGDICYGPAPQLERHLGRLNGQIHLLFGNHDKVAKQMRTSFNHTYNGILELSFGEIFVVCCHFPMLEWNRAFHGAIHLFGHVHSGPSKLFRHPRNSWDVGMDNNGFTPVSLTEIRNKIREAPESTWL